MFNRTVPPIAQAGALALGLLCAGPAPAAINFGPGGDTLLNGAFDQMSYGAGAAGRTNVVPLLYIGDFAQTDPASSATLGTELDFGYTITGTGTPIVQVTYTLEHTGDEFSEPFSDLRLMVATRAKGVPASLDVANNIGFGGGPGPNDPVQFRILDAGASGPTPIEQIRAANGLDGTNACGVGCWPEMALQWNRSAIAPGETWQVSFLLVDDLALVAGGRYLVASSLADGNQQLIFGNPTLVPEPQTYALVLAGLGLISWLRMRRHEST